MDTFTYPERPIIVDKKGETLVKSDFLIYDPGHLRAMGEVSTEERARITQAFQEVDRRQEIKRNETEWGKASARDIVDFLSWEDDKKPLPQALVDRMWELEMFDKWSTQDTDGSNINLRGDELHPYKIKDNANPGYRKFGVAARRNYEGLSFEGKSLKGENLWGVKFKGAKLKDTSFKNATLDFADFSETELAKQDFSGAHFKESLFLNAKLPEANFHDANFDEYGATNFTGADLRKAVFTRQVRRKGYGWDAHSGEYRTSLKRGIFNEADLREADFREQNIAGGQFNGADLKRADLRGANLAEASFKKADLREAQLTGAKLNQADLSGADLSTVELTGPNAIIIKYAKADRETKFHSEADRITFIKNGGIINGADALKPYEKVDDRWVNATAEEVSKAMLEAATRPEIPISQGLLDRFLDLDLGRHYPSRELANVNLTGLNLRGRSLSEAYLNNVNFRGADLQGVAFVRASCNETDFSEAKGLEGAIFRRAHLSATNFKGANLTGADFHNITFEPGNGNYGGPADFTGANLAKATFTREREAVYGKMNTEYTTHLKGSIFNKANLTEANFQDQNLEESQFEGAMLRGANLINAKLNRVSFKKADLRDVKLDRAEMWSVDFSSADLTTINFVNPIAEMGGSSKADRQTRFRSEADRVAFIKMGGVIYGADPLKPGEAVDERWINASAEEVSKAMLEAAAHPETPVTQGLLDRFFDLGLGHKFLGKELANVNLAGLNLRGRSLSKVNVEGVNFKDTKLRGVAFVETSCIKADFSDNQTLERAIFRKSNVGAANFKGANLRGADFHGVSSSDYRKHWGPANFSEANLAQAVFTGEVKRDGSFKTVEYKTSLYGFIFSGADLSQANLSEQSIQEGKFDGANLTLTNFRGSELKGCDFRGATFNDTDFGLTNLWGANFADCNLSGKINFFRADLSYADLTGTDLSGLNFSENGWGPGSVKGAKIDQNTVFSSEAQKAQFLAKGGKLLNTKA